MGQEGLRGGGGRLFGTVWRLEKDKEVMSETSRLDWRA